MRYLIVVMLLFMCSCSSRIAKEDVHDSGADIGLDGCEHAFPEMTTVEKLLAEKVYANDLALSEKEYPQGSIVSIGKVWLGDGNRWVNHKGGVRTGKIYVSENRWIVVRRKIEAVGVVLLIFPYSEIHEWGLKPVWVPMKRGQDLYIKRGAQ